MGKNLDFEEEAVQEVNTFLDLRHRRKNLFIS
jgi:hypothetical protein